jgi:ketosteroid isomerase-like protein
VSDQQAPEARTVREVFEHHIRHLQAGDLEGTLEDYGDDSVIVNMGGAVRGLSEIRAFFRNSIDACLPPETTYRQLFLHFTEDIAYSVWSAESPFCSVPYGVDTFFIRGGRIVRQSFAGILNMK